MNKRFDGAFFYSDWFWDLTFSDGVLAVHMERLRMAFL